MKKVLFTATVDSHILHFHLPYLKLFKDNGYEVHVATNGTEDIPYCDKKHIISFERSPYKINNLKAIKQLKKIIDKENYEIIHTHTPMGSVVTRLAAKKARKNGTRLIYTAHGFHFYKGAPIINWLLFYSIEKWLSKHTDTLITINNEDYELAKKKFKKTNIEYVPGVGIAPEKIDIKMTDKEKQNLRKELGLKNDDFVMICIGELNSNKNQIMQIEAMKNLITKYKNFKLLLAGNGDEKYFLQKKIKEYNLEKNILLLGYRKDIPRLLKISNLAISTSKREGLPVNVIEALALGVPVIGTNCRGTRDLIKDGENGFIVEIDDINNLANKINFIFEKKLKKINIEEIYLLENVLSKIKEIYFKKKKVIHILSSNKYSGAENVACTIIKETKKTVNAVYCSPKGEIEKKLSEENIDYIPLKKLKIKEIEKIINTFKPDIIHAHDFKASCYAALFSKKIKIISHIHGNNIKMQSLNIKSIVFKMLSKSFSKIIWVSDSAYNDYYFSKNVKDQSIVLYNVIDSEAIMEKSKLYNCNTNFDLIFLGRLAYPKNPMRLIEIVKTIVKKFTNLKVAIIGDGIERSEIEKLTTEYNLDKNITFFGYIDNPYPILKNSKIMIMTSIYEGTPMCALEAQAFGIPVVSTPVDGLKRIIKNDYNGYLSEKNSELSRAIVNFLSDDNLYKKMSKNSKAFFENYNNLDKYINTINKFYE